MTTTCEYTRISLYFVPYVYLVNFSLLYQLIGSMLQFYTQIVKSKNQPYPIWIRFVRVRHTGVYRVPHAVGRFHPTRTFTKMVGMTGLAPATSWLQIRPSPNWQYTPIKLVGDDGIEPPQADSKSAALPLCKSPVTKNYFFLRDFVLLLLT